MSPRRPARIGMIVPSSNTCLEPVTYRLLTGRGDVSVHFARVPVTRIGLDEGSDRQFSTDAMTAAAEQLADALVDVVVWNGTSGSWLGVERDRALAQSLGQAAGVPATTSTLALLAALEVYGVTRLGLATPYTEDVNEQIAGVYAGQGIELVADSALGISDNEAFARVPEERVAAQLREVGASEAHAVAVLCTNVHGAGIAEPLEAELGLPVLDSVAVTLWQALLIAGATSPVAGGGTLLRDGFLRAELQAICRRLLEGTGADRATIRLDVPRHALSVNLTAAERVAPGVRSIRRDGSLPQRRLATVEWLEAHRRDLVQPHFRADPRPPAALQDVYGVKAQMLGPVEHAGALAGWLSAHSLGERDWTADHVAALDRARTDVAALLEGVATTDG